MSTISVSDLKKRSPKQWRKSAKTGDLVVTAQGQPVAILLPIDADSLESTLSTLRSLRAVRAQAALQEAAEENETASFSMAQIDAEIAETRRSRRK